MGRSIPVGKPLALMLLASNATVTMCHTGTRNLSAVTKRAKILIAAAGGTEMITSDMVREGAVTIIDVCTNRQEKGTSWGCGLCRGFRKGFPYHACPRWDRSDDHRNACEKHR